MGLFSSLFSSKKTGEDSEAKADLKSFDLLKYDGIRALRMGKAAFAVNCFIEALAIQEDFETMKYLVSAYNALNMNDEVMETLNEMVETGEEPVNTLLMRANFLYINGKYAEATADCEKVIEQEPENIHAFFQLAKTASAVGDLPKAIEYLDKVTGLKGDFIEAYNLRATIQLVQEKGTDALADIEKVIELSPEDETAYLLRGRIYELLNNADAALLDYQQALELNPFNEAAYLLAGQLMINQEKYEEAIALLDEATEQIDQFEKAYAARAVAKHRIGDHEGALADEEKVKELRPDEKEKPDDNPNFDNLYKGGIF